MTLTEIVNQIRRNLPVYTSALSPILSLQSVSSSILGTATVTTIGSHGLQTGDPVVLVNFSMRNFLAYWSNVGDIYTFTTEQDHDLTLGWHETVSLSGFIEAEWNTTFELIDVPNRRTFKISSSLPSPTTSYKAELLENRIDGVDGYYQITVTAPSAFRIESDHFITAIYSGGSVLSGVRVAAAANIDRVLEQYTKQNTDDLWMIVLPVDVDVAKSIYADSDAVATITASDDFRLRLLDGFTLAIIKSTVNESAAVEAVDLCRHDLLKPILKTLCGVRFESGLTTSGDFRSSLIGHGVMQYTEAYIVYRYDFEVVMDTVVEDTVIEGDVTAFRDIELNQSVRIWFPD